jgi:hypothetical protein
MTEPRARDRAIGVSCGLWLPKSLRRLRGS